MAINFPNSPTNGQIFTSGGKSYEYNSTTGVWNRRPEATSPIPADVSDLTDTTNLLFDGQYSSLTGAPTSSTAGALGTLTKTFTQNEEAEITLSENISPVPNVSVFKEVPQGGLTSKGNWDVNANATNYDFFDEKPLNYNTITLTPSATGDGTFTSSNPTVTNYVHSKLTTNNSGLSNSGNRLHTLVTNAGTNDNQGTLDMYGVWMSPAGDKILAIQVFTNNIYRNRLHGFNVANPFSTTDADITYQTTGNGYYDIANGTTNNHRNGTFGIDPTGTHLYTFRSNTLYQYVATTGWEASTFSFTNNTFVPSGNGIPPNYDWQGPSPIPSNNGDYLLFCSAHDGYIARYTMTTAWDCSTCSSKQELDAATLLSNAGYTSSYFRTAQYNSDGTLLLLGNNDQFFKLSLSTPYDITTASFVEASSSGLTLGWYGKWITSGANEGKYVVGQTGNTSGGIVIQPTSESSAFSSTDVGKKVVGNSGSAVITATSGTYQSITPFADTSAISSWQLFGAEGKSDGTGIELSGFSSSYGTIYGKSLSDVVNHTTDAFNSVNFLIDVVISPDGTKLFYTQYNDGKIYERAISTAWDLSTISLTDTISGGHLLPNAPATYISGFTWSTDGMKLYVVYPNSSTMAEFYNDPNYPQYAFRVDTLTYAGSNKTLNTNLSSGNTGIIFKNDGTMVFISNSSTPSVYSWPLSTAWDLSTAGTRVQSNINFSSNTLQCLAMSADGTSMIVGNETNDNLQHFTLSTPFDITTMTETSQTHDINTVITGSMNNGAENPNSIQWADNGNRFFVYTVYNGGSLTSTDQKAIYQFSTSSATHPYSQYSPALTNSTGQIDSSSWVDLDSMAADETKNDGDVFYAVSTDNRTSWGVIKDGDGVRKIARNNSGTWQYNNDGGSATYYDFSNPTAGAVATSFTTPGWTSLAFNTSGDRVLLTDDSYLYSYPLNTSWDISTIISAPIGTSPIVLGAGSGLNGFVSYQISDDGTKAIGRYNGNGVTYEYSMSTPFDVTTLSLVGSANLGLGGQFYIKPGTYDTFYVTSGRSIHKYTFTGGSITTGTLTQDGAVNLDPTNTKSFGYGQILFKPDGTEFYITQTTDSIIEKWTLGTAWDITTATKSSETAAFSGIGAVWLKPDGTKIYYIDTNNSNQLSEINIGGFGYGTSETWVDGTNNNEHATLQEALGAQSFNRMDKAQLQAVTDPNHYVLGNTLDLMIAPYATSGTSPLSDGVTIGYQSEALIKQAINGTDYEAEFPALNKVKIKSLAAQNLKIRVI